jgi:hypothetical protein
MNSDAHRIPHDYEVGKDPRTPQQDVSLSRDKLDGPERPYEGLESLVQIDDRLRPVAKDRVPVTRTARMPLILPREGPAAVRARPHEAFVVGSKNATDQERCARLTQLVNRS